MTHIAIIDQYISSNIKPNSLTQVKKYHFENYIDAARFVKDLRKIDRRVISCKIEESE